MEHDLRERGLMPEGVRFMRWTVETPEMAAQREAERQAALRKRLAQPWPGHLPPIVTSPGPWRVNVFDGHPHPSHHQILFEPMETGHNDGAMPDPAQHFAGQRNGLCGAALPDWMCLMTGVHTGRVALSIDLFSEAPPLEHDWEDIVELSFQVVYGRVLLAPLLGESWPLVLPLGCYRVRCLATGMSDDHDVRSDDEPGERIAMQWWREPAPRPDQIIKVGSEHARVQHRVYGSGA